MSNKSLKKVSITVMDLHSMIYEIEALDKELKRLRSQVREFNSLRKKYMDSCIQILEERGDTEIKISGKKYILTEKIRQPNKPQKQRIDSVLEVLEERGIYGSEANEILRELTGATKGEEIRVVSLVPKK